MLDARPRTNRQAAAAALGKIDPQASSAARKLAEGLDDDDSDVPNATYQALPQIDPMSELAARTLGKVPNNMPLADELDPSDVRPLRVLRALPDDSQEQVTPPAKEDLPLPVKMLDDKDWRSRSSAAVGSAKFGREAKLAVTPLIASPKDENAFARVCAIEALGGIGPEAAPATAGLIERLQDEHASARSAAARALGQIGTAAKAAVPALEKLRHDPEDYVRQAAGEALEKIGEGLSGKR